MPIPTKALIKAGPGQPFKVGSVELPDVKPDQVLIDVKYCGICHSDLAMSENHWGLTTYPFVGGHEVAGVVSQVGSEVKNVKVGDHVGAGWQSGSCRSCKECLSGHPNVCLGAERTIVGRHGGFASKVVVNNEWCVKIPSELELAEAGPFLCAGITVFTPLFETPVLPTSTVGIISVGGLGHLAIQFAAAWGCSVIAFTSSEDKAKMAMDLGASQVINSTDSAEIMKVANQIDLLMMCGTSDLDWDAYFATLAPRGKLHFCGVPPNPVAVQMFPVLLKNLSLTGTPVGSPDVMAEMLKFAARHKIKSVNEKFNFTQVEEAFDHLKAGKTRLRLVMKNDLDA